jgi:protein-S-isoprenylcysteine O-methyltransferase Ste14
MQALHLLVTLAVAACWVAVGVVFVVDAVYQAVRRPVRPGARLATLVRSLAVEPWMLVVLAVLGLATALLPQAVWARLAFRNPVLQALGVALLVASTLLTLWARLTLARMWSGLPWVRPDHELRTDGPYAITRHPIYTGFTGMLLGTALGLGAALLLVFVVALPVMFAVRMRTEERLMVEAFGDRYRDYRRRVPALLPLPRPPRPAR